MICYCIVLLTAFYLWRQGESKQRLACSIHSCFTLMLTYEATYLSKIWDWLGWLCLVHYYRNNSSGMLKVRLSLCMHNSS